MTSSPTYTSFWQTGHCSPDFFILRCSNFSISSLLSPFDTLPIWSPSSSSCLIMIDLLHKSSYRGRALRWGWYGRRSYGWRCTPGRTSSCTRSWLGSAMDCLCTCPFPRSWPCSGACACRCACCSPPTSGTPGSARPAACPTCPASTLTPPYLPRPQDLLDELVAVEFRHLFGLVLWVVLLPFHECEWNMRVYL